MSHRVRPIDPIKNWSCKKPTIDVLFVIVINGRDFEKYTVPCSCNLSETSMALSYIFHRVKAVDHPLAASTVSAAPQPLYSVTLAWPKRKNTLWRRCRGRFIQMAPYFSIFCRRRVVICQRILFLVAVLPATPRVTQIFFVASSLIENVFMRGIYFTVSYLLSAVVIKTHRETLLEYGIIKRKYLGIIKLGW